MHILIASIKMKVKIVNQAAFLLIVKSQLRGIIFYLFAFSQGVFPTFLYGGCFNILGLRITA